MYPYLLELGKFKLPGYGVMIATGLIVAFIIFDRRTKSRGYNEDHIFNITCISVVGGFLGAKILYYITEIDSIIEDPSRIIETLTTGFVVYGGIIGGAITFYLITRKYKYKPLKAMDLAVASLAIGQGFGRIGCFLAGCCYGQETTLPIGIEFKNSPFAPNDVSLFPTQIISSIFNFTLAIFLIKYNSYLEKKGVNQRGGKVTAAYIIIYSIGRFIIEFFRGDLERGFVGTLSTSQFISIGTVIVGIILFNLDKIKIFKGKEAK